MAWKMHSNVTSFTNILGIILKICQRHFPQLNDLFYLFSFIITIRKNDAFLFCMRSSYSMILIDTPYHPKCKVQTYFENVCQSTNSPWSWTFLYKVHLHNTLKSSTFIFVLEHVPTKNLPFQIHGFNQGFVKTCVACAVGPSVTSSKTWFFWEFI